MKLGKLQKAMLRDIVKTNGGGRSGYVLKTNVMRSLERKGLIQGKMNEPSTAVHTRLGLEWVRNVDKEKAGAL